MSKGADKTNGYSCTGAKIVWSFLIDEYWHCRELLQSLYSVCAVLTESKKVEKLYCQMVWISSNRIFVSPDLSIQRM